MHVLLTSPTIEQACLSFEMLLAGTWYFADDNDWSTDVAYTFPDTLAKPVYRWIEAAKASGLIEQAIILEAPKIDGTLPEGSH